mmetsp:Transcript_140281/g.244332  ORF Transcript_140281/g.244332 Transcript_140281/m.244332 type:complete len:84 (+) Transcript_140281:146-397(+)
MKRFNLSSTYCPNNNTLNHVLLIGKHCAGQKTSGKLKRDFKLSPSVQSAAECVRCTLCLNCATPYHHNLGLRQMSVEDESSQC